MNIVDYLTAGSYPTDDMNRQLVRVIQVDRPEIWSHTVEVLAFDNTLSVSAIVTRIGDIIEYWDVNGRSPGHMTDNRTQYRLAPPDVAWRSPTWDPK